MFTTFIVQPIFNLLVLIYALIPGHNFGLSLIVFTIIIRLLLWPLLRKQLHQTKKMRQLQPELKKIKAETKGDKRKEQERMMELYREKGINPVGMFPILIIQFIVLIGLYLGLKRVIDNPHNLIDFAYPSLQQFGWLQELKQNIGRFDNTLFGIVDLSKAALGTKGGWYFPGLLLVAGSAIVQFFASKQLLPQSDTKRKLRDIMKDASEGRPADQAEVNAAVSRGTIYLIPLMIFFFTLQIPSALSLYWFVSGLVALAQQSLILREDEQEMEALADKPGKNPAEIPEAEVVERPKPKTHASKKTAKKRRKKR